ncbi:MAG: acyl carrier protein [Streptomyces sp.]|nr:acyl carrier protein [Streptomyces sp.]
MQDDRAQAFMTTLTQQLAAVRPETAQRHITERSRLTGDLGLDSVELAELFERIRETYAGVEISNWLATATRAEGDTVGSLVRYLALAVPEDRPLVAGSAR